MYNHKKGFTLVELLVVISIIALLLAILVPALNSARRSAQTIVCATNLKNYAPAMHMYTQDNNGKLPFIVSWLYSQKTIEKGVTTRKCMKECRWHYDVDPPDGSLWPYLKDKNVHLCPTYKNYAMTAKCLYSGHSRVTPFKPTYSYAMNWHLGHDWASFLSGQTGTRDFDGKTVSITFAREISLKIEKVTRTTECFAFAEEDPWVVGQRLNDAPKWYSNVALNDNALWLNANKSGNFPNDATDNFATYHNTSPANKNEGRANVVFIDGHTKAVKGLAGYDAYMEYGRPFNGHEKLNIW